MQKRRKKTRILAIDPGSREMGIAILEDKNLAYYGVKTLKKKRPESILINSVRHIIYTLVDRYQPDILTVEKIFEVENQDVSLLKLVNREVKYVARKRNLRVKSYSPIMVRQKLCGEGRATKRKVAEILTNTYPELKVYLDQERYWKEKYWLNMFDAVALGLACHEFQEANNTPSSRSLH